LKGDANAQFFLGGMYEAGQGVAQGNVEAYMWFNLAAITGKKDAVKYRDLAASIMTQQQLAEAQKLAKECLSRNYKGC
jgi:TPR repeat protein